MEIVSELGTRSTHPEIAFSPRGSAANVAIEFDGQLIRVDLHANDRTNRRALLNCVFFLAMVVLAIGIMFALFGAWLIFPFAGLEILLLATGALIGCSRTDDADTLVISKNYVHLKQRRGSIQSVNSFIRKSTKIQLMPGRTGHEPSRLLVVCRADHLEIGEFLVESSRRRLYRQLTEWVRNNV